MTELMTAQEHTEIYKTMAETIVQEDLPLDERVERGALHLDEHIPGWANKINLERFQISSAENCVIGQLYGDYWNHTINKVAKIYPDRMSADDWNCWGSDQKLDKFAAHHGFMTDADPDRTADWDILQESWVRAIKARQSGK